MPEQKIHLVKGAGTTKEVKEDEPVDGKSRFRVALISMAAEIRTIYAVDGQAAVKLCSEQNLGRPAGRQGPTMVSVAASNFEDSPEPPDFIKLATDQFIQAGYQAAEAQASQIVKPNIVLPPGFDPKGPKGA